MVDDTEKLLAVVHADKKMFNLYQKLGVISTQNIGLFQTKIIRPALEIVRSSHNRGGITTDQLLALEKLEQKAKGYS